VPGTVALGLCWEELVVVGGGDAKAGVQCGVNGPTLIGGGGAMTGVACGEAARIICCSASVVAGTGNALWPRGYQTSRSGAIGSATLRVANTMASSRDRNFL
jgi:hypothetical protein